MTRKLMPPSFVSLPSGLPKVKEGVILHVTDNDQIVALEILNASQRIPLKNLFKLEVSKAAG